MDENKIGQFIAELRKEKKLTQKDLAAQLHITDILRKPSITL